MKHLGKLTAFFLLLALVFTQTALASGGAKAALALNRTRAAVAVGGTLTLKAKATSGAELKWKSSDSSVASVNQLGVVEGVKAGKATISVGISGTSLQKSCAVTVKAPSPTKVSFDSAALSLKPLDTQTVSASVLPANADQTLVYQSSNKRVATVSQAGLVTAVGAGKCRIRARAVNGKAAYLSVRVSKESVNLKGSIIDISKYQTVSDWSKLKKSVSLIILRCGYTFSKTMNAVMDEKFTLFASKCKEYNIPFGVYYYGRATNATKARYEAEKTMEFASKYDPLFYAYDAEEASISGEAINAYAKALQSLGARKTGHYIAHHLYSQYKKDGMDPDLVDFMWIPRYGGSKPAFDCDLWQYTSSGSVPGLSARIDMNKLTGTKSLKWFLS